MFLGCLKWCLFAICFQHHYFQRQQLFIFLFSTCHTASSGHASTFGFRRLGLKWGTFVISFACASAYCIIHVVFAFASLNINIEVWYQYVSIIKLFAVCPRVYIVLSCLIVLSIGTSIWGWTIGKATVVIYCCGPGWVDFVWWIFYGFSMNPNDPQLICFKLLYILPQVLNVGASWNCVRKRPDGNKQICLMIWLWNLGHLSTKCSSARCQKMTVPLCTVCFLQILATSHCRADEHHCLSLT